MITDNCCCGSEFHIDLDGGNGTYARDAEIEVYNDWRDRHEKCLQIKQSIMLIEHSFLLQKTRETTNKSKTAGGSTSGLN